MNRNSALLILAGLCVASVSSGVTLQELGVQQNERIARENAQRQRMLERERLLRELERSLRPIQIPKAQAPQRPKSESVQPAICFDIKQINVRGADLLTEGEKVALISPYLNRCLYLTDIDQLRTKIDQFYINNGWVTSKSYLSPNQNLKSGVLELTVLEGKLDSIVLNKNTLFDRWRVSTAFPDTKEEVMNIRDIEQGLEQMNRLRSSSAKMGIHPVEGKPGWSQVHIKDSRNDRWRSTLGYDNKGSESTGVEKGKLTLEVDDLLALNDAWTITATDYVGKNQMLKGNESVNVTVSIPYGYWLYDASANQSEYLSTVTSAAQPFQTSGNSANYHIGAKRLLKRDKKGKTYLTLKLDNKRSENFLQDVKLESSSRNLTVMGVGVNHTRFVKQGSWSLNLTYNRGLELFDAVKDIPEVSNTIPKSQFERLNWDINYNRSLPNWLTGLSYQGMVSGQWSSTPLYGSEQISVGGSGSVRGYVSAPASGEDGTYWRNDFNWMPKTKYKALKNLTLGVGFDIGVASSKAGNISGTEKPEFWLAGLGLSVSQSYKIAQEQSLDWRVTTGYPLTFNDHIDYTPPKVEFEVNLKWW